MDTTTTLEAGGICLEPCKQERRIELHEDRIKALEDEMKGLRTDGAETKVYMKQVLDSQSEIKQSIKEIQAELKDARSLAPVPVPEAEHQDWVATTLPHVLDLAKIALIIAGAVVGIKLAM